MRLLSLAPRIFCAAALPAVLFCFSLPGFTAAYAKQAAVFGPQARTAGIEVSPVAHIPFSAMDRVVWTNTAEGGHTFTVYVYARLARDGEGRIYREIHNFSPDQGVDPQKTLQGFSVTDPTNGTRTNCTVETHRCEVTDYGPTERVLAPEGPSNGGKQWLTRDSLGAGKFDGLPVTGTRETIRLSSRGGGKESSIASLNTSWYSDELKAYVSVVDKDQRAGTRTFTLTNISRQEPEPGTFAIPTGYTVVDMRHADTAHLPK